MKKNFVLIGIIFLIFCGDSNCQNNIVLLDHRHEIIISEDTAHIYISKFSVLPDEIDGCGCYFFASTEDEKAEQYIYVNNFANLAFMIINDEKMKFELYEHNENNNIYSYKYKDVRLRIEITKRKFDEYENSNVEGVITIEIGKHTKKQSFVGTCGC